MVTGLTVVRFNCWMPYLSASMMRQTRKEDSMQMRAMSSRLKELRMFSLQRINKKTVLFFIHVKYNLFQGRITLQRMSTPTRLAIRPAMATQGSTMPPSQNVRKRLTSRSTGESALGQFRSCCSFHLKKARNIECRRGNNQQ